MKQIQQKICVVGCAGFIGSHLTRRLLADTSFTVYGIDLVNQKIRELLSHDHFEFVQADVHDTEVIQPIISSCDLVISLTAICNPSLYNTDPLRVIASNFTEPLNLINLCAALGKRLIHFSTSEVYGKTIFAAAGETPADENDGKYVLQEDATPLILGPVSAQRWSYAAAKQLLERVIYGLGDAGRLEYTIIRPFNFIGPRMDFIPGIDGEGIPRVLACFMDALLFNKPLQLVDGGKSRRAFTAIEDAVEAIVTIIKKPAESKNQIFNIGNPRNEVSITELADLMMSIFHSLYPQYPVPEKKYVTAQQFYGKGYEDSDRRVPDISKAVTLLGWKPRISLKDALTSAIISYKEHYANAYAA